MEKYGLFVYEETKQILFFIADNLGQRVVGPKSSLEDLFQQTKYRGIKREEIISSPNARFLKKVKDKHIDAGRILPYDQYEKLPHKKAS